MKKTIIAFILIALVFGIYWALDKNMERRDAAMEGALVSDDNAVYLADQLPGDETVVSYAKLSEPGYVLVYGTDPATGDKVVVGSSAYLPAGEHRNVRIAHRGHIHKDNQEISAVVVADDGDGVYDPAEDDEELTDEYEADVDAEAQDPEDLTVAEIAEELDDAGYDVDVDVVEEANQAEAQDDGEDVDQTGAGAGAAADTDDSASTTDDAQ